MGKSNKIFHIALSAVPVLAIILLYTTKVELLVGLATGVTLGMSLRLLFAHKKNGFVGTRKLDWVLMAGFGSLAMVLMLAEAYTYLPFPLAFVAMSALVNYFKLYRKTPEVDL